MAIDVRFWSQQLSFFFVGLMIVLSIRGLLNELSKFFKAFSRHVSSSNIILFLAHIMGLYFLSSVLTMRQNLPLEFRYDLKYIMPKVSKTSERSTPVANENYPNYIADLSYQIL
jgi:hypothetical protein